MGARSNSDPLSTIMSIKTASELYGKFNKLTTAPNLFHFATESQISSNDRTAFPMKVGETDSRDNKYAIRKRLVGAGSGQPNDSAVIPGVGMAIADEDFFDYAESKEQQEMLFDFKKFVAAQADLQTPAAAAWWYENFSWLKDEKIAELDQQAELQKKLAKIQIMGPQNEEDMLTLYMVNKGLIKVTEQPLHRLGQSRDIESTTFKQGFFNPMSQPQYQTMQTNTTPNWGNPLQMPASLPAGPYTPGGKRFPNPITPNFAGGNNFYSGGATDAPGAGPYRSFTGGAATGNNFFSQILFG